MENKSEKPCITKFSLLIVQNLWLPHYQILLKILLKELIRLDVNMGMIHAEINTKIVIVILSTKALKMIE